VRRLCIVLGVTAVVASIAASIAAAQPAPNPNAPIQSCFGIASGQLASSQPRITGEHASSFDEPRVGIGNIAFHDALGLGITFGSVGEVGSLLAMIDENPATFCP
jgi:hypothetical protein